MRTRAISKKNGACNKRASTPIKLVPIIETCYMMLHLIASRTTTIWYFQFRCYGSFPVVYFFYYILYQHRRLMRFVPTLSREHGVNHITQTQQSQSTTMIELLLPLSAPMLPSSRRSSVPAKLPLPLLPLIALLFRSAAAASTGETEILREEQQDEERFHQYLCSSLSAASAWFVLVIVSFVIESQILLIASVCFCRRVSHGVLHFSWKMVGIARPNYYLSRPLRACCFGLYCSHDIVGAMKGACRILACIKSCAATGVLCSIPVMNFKGIFIKPFLAVGSLLLFLFVLFF